MRRPGKAASPHPLSHLLAAVGIGLEECHYPGAQR